MSGRTEPSATAVVGRFLDRMRAHDWDGMASCLSDDVVRVGPFGDTYRGKADYVAFIAGLLPSLPGYELRVDRVLRASGSTVVAELTETVAIDGRRVDTPEALVFDHDAGGLIARISIYIRRAPAGTRDWAAWAREVEQALDVANRGRWPDLFAPGAVFRDPATPGTTDVRKISRDTRAIFPDWRQEITWIRGGDDWAVFEWIGRATYAGDPGRGAAITMHGATIVEVDGDGRITSWRDYLDRKEPEHQIRTAVKGRP